MSALSKSARIRLAGVGFAYRDAQPIVERVELVLRPGWTALAGPNGAGKTTLLRLIAGELTPSTGHVRREPMDLSFACTEQAPDRPSELVARFAWNWEASARERRSRLRLDPLELDRWPTLSPGERQRWQIAAVLDRDPDVLLLDEPTNHLDRDALAALREGLREYRGVGLVVAHDRAFLDALAERVWWVQDGAVHEYAGTYSDAREQMQSARATAIRERDELERELRREERELDERSRRLRAAQHQRSAGTRMKNPRDSDGRGALRHGKAEMGAAAHSRAVAVMNARSGRTREALRSIAVEREFGGDLFLDWIAAPREVLLRAELGVVAMGDRALFDAGTLTVRKHDRVHVAGPNGAGKTTLLERLRAHWTLPADRLLWIPQDPAIEERHDALARLRAMPSRERGHTLRIVAALGVDPDRLLASPEPSPGEAKKLLLAEGLARQVWCVMLDEPTNHLDVPSIERLESALAAYPGALLVITHDDALAAATTSKTLEIRNGVLR